MRLSHYISRSGSIMVRRGPKTVAAVDLSRGGRILWMAWGETTPLEIRVYVKDHVDNPQLPFSYGNYK